MLGTVESGQTDSGAVSAGGEPVLTVRGIRKTYEADGAPVRALRGADLTLSAGEFAAIMGPSGCGKSTLLNMVAGLDQADEGEIVLAGENVTGRSEDDLARMRRRHIGIVFQFFNLLEGMSALENVVLPAVVAGLPRKQAETRARDLLDLLGLGDKVKAAPGVLSGGRSAGGHVAGILFVAGSISDDEFPLVGREEAVSDIDGDALLTLSLKPIEQKREVDVLTLRAMLDAVALQGGELVFEDQLGVVEQPADQRGLPIIDRATGDEAQHAFLGGSEFANRSGCRRSAQWGNLRGH